MNFFLDAFQANFLEMTGVPCVVHTVAGSAAHYTSHGIAVIIGVTGQCHGRVIVDCAEETATRFMQKVFKSEDVSQNEVLNGLAEFANIVAGHGVSQINDKYKGLEFRLTPPQYFVRKSSQHL